MKTWKQVKTTLTHTLFARVPGDLYRRAQRAAGAHFNGSLSDLVRWAIETGLKELENDNSTDGKAT
jgi:hypothetical protein